MNQGIIRSLKCSYKAEMLQRIIQTNPSADVLQNKKMLNIKDYLFLLSDAWQSVSQETLVNAWHNLWPASLFIDTESSNSSFDGFHANEAKLKAVELMDYAKKSSCKVTEILDDDEIFNWITSNDEIPSTEILTDEEIISTALNPEDSSSEETESDEEAEKISLEQGLAVGENYLNFLLQQDFISEQEIMTVRRIQEKINNHKNKTLKQTTILQLFKKQNAK